MGKNKVLDKRRELRYTRKVASFQYEDHQEGRSDDTNLGRF